MKKLTLDEIYDQLNGILLKKRLIPEALNFDELSTLQALSLIYDVCKLLEYKLYYKGQKKAGIYLRRIYTLCEKLSMHEKKRIQEYKFNELEDSRVIWKGKDTYKNVFKENTKIVDEEDEDDIEDREDNIEDLEKRLNNKDIMGDDIIDDDF